jgi:hypothetical protein
MKEETALLLIEKFGVPPELLLTDEGIKKVITVREGEEVLFNGTIKKLSEEIETQEKYSRAPSQRVRSENYLL